MRVDTPNPGFVEYRQQAIGGIEDEVRVAVQDLYHTMRARGGSKYRDLRPKISRIPSSSDMRLPSMSRRSRSASRRRVRRMPSWVGAMIPRHLQSSGLPSTPIDFNGVPFCMGRVYALGNIAADMFPNAMAEMTGRTQDGNE